MQIAAIANRTTIADGNTWNHEHIALLGKTLTTDLDEGWEIARHLADAVLSWGGGSSDFLARSPRLSLIATVLTILLAALLILGSSRNTFASDDNGGIRRLDLHLL